MQRRPITLIAYRRAYMVVDTQQHTVGPLVVVAILRHVDQQAALPSIAFEIGVERGQQLFVRQQLLSYTSSLIAIRLSAVLVLPYVSSVPPR